MPASFASYDPDNVIVENVAALLTRGMDTVLGSLAEVGYDAQWQCISAAAVGAPHLRERIWIVAYPAGEQGRQVFQSWVWSDSQSSGAIVAHTSRLRIQEQRLPAEGRQVVADVDGRREGLGDPAISRLPDWAGGTVGQPSPLTEFERPGGREIERDFRGMAYGVRNRVDRLRALGNSVVPQIPEWIGYRILEAEKGLNL